MKSGVWDCPKNDPGPLLDWVHAQLMTVPGVTGATRPTPDSVELHTQMIPGWAVFVAILFFPIGLLALFAKQQMAMLVRVVPGENGGSVMYVNGNGSRNVEKMMTYVYYQTATAA